MHGKVWHHRTRTGIGLALLTIAGVAAVALIAPGSDRRTGAAAARVPTEAEARTVLTATYERARNETDPRRFCEPSEYPLSCLSHYNEAGADTVPAAAPQVLGARTTDNALVLSVCGSDGRGRAYRSDFPVVRSDGQLRPLLDVFWTSSTYSGTKPDGERVNVTPRGPHPTGCSRGGAVDDSAQSAAPHRPAGLSGDPGSEVA